MEKQFAAIQTNQDSLFSTPGRFVHICMEMNLRLTSVEYVVLDAKATWAGGPRAGGLEKAQGSELECINYRHHLLPTLGPGEGTESVQSSSR